MVEEGKYVYGGVECEGIFFSEVVRDRLKETLLEIIKRRILPETKVSSDF